MFKHKLIGLMENEQVYIGKLNMIRFNILSHHLRHNPDCEIENFSAIHIKMVRRNRIPIIVKVQIAKFLRVSSRSAPDNEMLRTLSIRAKRKFADFGKSAVRYQSCSCGIPENCSVSFISLMYMLVVSFRGQKQHILSYPPGY